jgi:lipopolysaccharide/colanic/teichoic acid biosynthesis glycosyltransferase
MLIITLPFQIAIAILVKITDPGPIIYKHSRLGRNNNKIEVYKFRTMKAKFCTGPQFGGRTDEDILKQFGKAQVEEFKKRAKLDDDPRVSKLGGFLRKTSLDELPQLWNILKGDLSLVGPRPIPYSEVELVGGEQKLARILTIRPGLTGLWQVSGRNNLDYAERIKLNIYYLENWSIWLDMRIIWKTAVILVSERNGQ